MQDWKPSQQQRETMSLICGATSLKFYFFSSIYSAHRTSMLQFVHRVFVLVTLKLRQICVMILMLKDKNTWCLYLHCSYIILHHLVLSLCNICITCVSKEYIMHHYYIILSQFSILFINIQCCVRVVMKFAIKKLHFMKCCCVCTQS